MVFRGEQRSNCVQIYQLSSCNALSRMFSIYLVTCFACCKDQGVLTKVIWAKVYECLKVTSVTEMIFNPPCQSVDGVGESAICELGEPGGIARRRGGILGIHRLRSCHGHSINDVVDELLLSDDWLWGLVALFEDESGHDSEKLRGMMKM